MQTINDKRKYKLQQLFKMLSISLYTGLESFSPLSMMVCLTQPRLQFSQVACWLLVYVLLHGAVVAMETVQVTLDPYQAFQMQSICN